MLIVDNMTNREMYNEILEDAPNVTVKLEHTLAKYRREIIKKTRFPVIFKAMDYISPKKNHWIIIIRAFSKKDADVPVINYACVANAKGGFYAFMVSWYNNAWTIIMFPPHLFQRYRDRFLEGDKTLTGIDLIKYFFSRNRRLESDENVTDKRIINTSCEDGVCFGEEKEKNFIVLKTFVTYEMLKGKQIDTFENLYDLRYKDEI